MKKPKLEHRIKNHLTEIDWSLSNQKIGEIYGESRDVVRYWRKKLNLPSLPQSQPHPLADQIDWSRPTQEIAHQYGMSLTTANKWKRRRKGKPVKHTSANRPLNAQDAQAMKTAREGGCALCGYNKFPVAGHFHHIHHRARGGSDALSNLIYLCANCHAEVHAGLHPLETQYARAVVPAAP